MEKGIIINRKKGEMWVEGWLIQWSCTLKTYIFMTIMNYPTTTLEGGSLVCKNTLKGWNFVVVELWRVKKGSKIYLFGVCNRPDWQNGISLGLEMRFAEFQRALAVAATVSCVAKSFISKVDSFLKCKVADIALVCVCTGEIMIMHANLLKL